MRVLILSTLFLVSCGSSATKPSVQNSAPREALSDPLSLVPAESDLVMKIDVAALRRSSLWVTYEKDVLELVAPGFAECGYNPLGEMSTVTVGIPMGSELGVFVFRGVDRDRTLDCLKTSKIETKTTAKFDGEFVSLVNKSGNINMITFVDAKTMVMQGSKNPTRETLTKALGMGAPLRGDREYLAAEAKVAPGAAIAMISRPGSKEFAQGMQEKLGAPVHAFNVSVHVTDVLTARIVIVMQNADDAAAIIENLKPQLETMRQYVDRYDARAEAETILIDVAVTEAQIKMFVEIVKSAMGTDAD